MEGRLEAMLTSGLAITVSDDPAQRAGALAALAATPGLTLGPSAGARVAAVLEAPSAAAGEAACEALAALPGVLQVALVCVLGLDDEPRDGAEPGSDS